MVSDDGADLTLGEVTLNDTASVHCNASNVHGYVLASAALRVYRMYWIMAIEYSAAHIIKPSYYKTFVALMGSLQEGV